jgi:hypothetical protein
MLRHPSNVFSKKVSKKFFKCVLKKNVKHKLSNFISPCIIMIGPQFCDFIPNDGDFTNNLK